MISVLRIDHHDDSKSMLICALVPVIAELELREDISVCWLHRHWKFGPHLLVLVETPGEPTAAALAAVEAAIRREVRALPSTVELDHDRWLAMSAQLGQSELVPGPYGPIRANNNVEWVTDTTLDTFIRSDTALRTKGRLIASALPIVVEALSRGEEATRISALTGMMSLACRYPDGGMSRGYLAFLSHWKEFLHWIPSASSIESRWSESYDAQRQVLAEMLRSVESQDPSTFPEVIVWDSWVRSAQTPAFDLARDGHALPYPHAGRLELAKNMSEQLGRRWGGDDDRSYSDFHVEFRKLDFTKLGHGDSFSAYRFMINCFFDLITLMDISAIERYTLTFLLTRTIEEEIGGTWREIVAAGVVRQAKDPDARPTLPWRSA